MSDVTQKLRTMFLVILFGLASILYTMHRAHIHTRALASKEIEKGIWRRNPEIGDTSSPGSVSRLPANAGRRSGQSGRKTVNRETVTKTKTKSQRVGDNKADQLGERDMLATDPRGNVTGLRESYRNEDDRPGFAESRWPVRVCTVRERTLHTSKMCKELGLPAARLPRFYSDERHGMLFCPITKVGSTSWLALLLYANNATGRSWPPVHNDKLMAKGGVPLFTSLNATNRERRLRSFYKWLVVRHPFDRLVSAWRDKLTMANSPYRKNMGRAIIQRYRWGDNNETRPEYKNVARFDEFVQFLYETKRGDQHWGTYQRTCSPCSVDWDAILRTETNDEDAHFILERLPRYGKGVPFIHSHAKNYDYLFQADKDLSEYFSRVSPEAMEYIWKQYGTDMRLFGYEWDQENFIAKCRIPTERGDDCC